MNLLRAVLALVLLGAAPASAPEWLRQRGVETLAELAAAFPNSANVQLRLLNQQLTADDEAGARVTLGRLAAIGYALSPAGQEQVAALLGEAGLAAMRANAQPIERSSTYATIPTTHGLIEGIATLPGGRIAASSVTAKALVIGRDKRWKVVQPQQSGSLSGLSSHGRVLWAASGVLEQTPSPEQAFRGLIAFDPRNGRELRRVAAPASVTLSDITSGPDGTVYASDPLTGGVYSAAPGARQVSELVPPGRLRSAQGLAVSADGGRLYISDYRYGLALVDLASGAVTRLEADEPMMLDGIDGLMRDGNRLIGIQNGTRPMRIVAITLFADGRRATRLEVLERAHREWIEPTTGQITGRRLLYVGNAAWDRYGTGGTLKGDGPLVPTQIRALPL